MRNISSVRSSEFIDLFNHGHSCYEISKQTGISKKSVIRVLREHGINTSKHKTNHHTDTLESHKQEIIDMYNQGMSGYKISKQIGHSQASISRLLHKYRVHIRPSNIYEVDHNFFDNIDNEAKAYILGWWYSDGNVCKDEYRIRLCITDLEILKKIKSCLGYTGQIYIKQPPKKFPNYKIQYELSITSKNLWTNLINKGCYPNKTLTITFPANSIIPDNLIHHFIRGLWDGDGSVFYRYISLTSTRTLLQVLSFKLEKLIGVKFSWYQRHPERNNDIWTISISNQQNIIKVLDWLYNGASLYMRRKYDNYQLLVRV